MSDDYQKLLERALSQLPKRAEQRGRFEPPHARSSVSGNRTILLNLKEICERIGRDREHLLRYLAGELATSASTDADHVIFQGRFDNRTIDSLIQRYIENAVLCPICRQPDTKIVRRDRISQLQCEACGAASPIRGI
ncbi:MAG: translation initiation factor IF-2 subunit beta [Candidatus Bathyarchaeia archaeon]